MSVTVTDTETDVARTGAGTGGGAFDPGDGVRFKLDPADPVQVAAAADGEPPTPTPGDGASATFEPVATHAPASNGARFVFAHDVAAGRDAAAGAASRFTGLVPNGAAIGGPGSGGGFGPRRVHGLGQHQASSGVVAADVTGDGTLDPAAANHAGNTVSMPPGDGPGGFGAAVFYTAGLGPSPVAAATATPTRRPRARAPTVCRCRSMMPEIGRWIA